jgi:hypothetical protein
LAETRLVVKKDHKIIITFALATLTPTIVWIVFVPLTLLIMVIRNPTGLGVAEVNLRMQIIRFLLAAVWIYLWIIFFAIFVFGVSIVHMLFLGVPSFIVANRLNIIHWYTVLPASFFIGGAPYILFMWGTPKDMWIGVPMTMGIFGFSAGMAFWLLWRYWVSPENYAKKAISIASHMP